MRQMRKSSEVMSIKEQIDGDVIKLNEFADRLNYHFQQGPMQPFQYELWRRDKPLWLKFKDFFEGTLYIEMAGEDFVRE